MRIIGITGPSGAGKSLLSDSLRDRDIPVIDADEVYHSLLVPPSPCLDALRNAFGDRVFTPDGALDRRELSDIVFHDDEKLALLNKTVLGFVIDKLREMLSAYENEGYGIAAVDAPTLIESGFYLECDRVVSVLSARAIRTDRIIARDGITREAAELRVGAQRNDAFYIEHSDAVLVNDSDEESFLVKCRELISKLDKRDP